MEPQSWLPIRLTILACGFVFALVVPVPDKLLGPLVMMQLLVCLPAAPFVFAVADRMMSHDPRFDEVWTRPTHGSNPFYVGNPLLISHFLAFLLMALGAGWSIGASVHGVPQFLFGCIIVLCGSAFLAEVHLAMRLCKDKMAPEPEETPNE